jgi:hypothetical protein
MDKLVAINHIVKYKQGDNEILADQDDACSAWRYFGGANVARTFERRYVFFGT